MNEAHTAWTWRHAFSTSDLPATTKHVLHTLGMFMNELGEGCYPSVADICRYSGLDKKTVLKHLAAARDAGWIAVSQHGYRGQRWKRQEYAARWPERDLTAGCVPDSAPSSTDASHRRDGDPMGPSDDGARRASDDRRANKGGGAAPPAFDGEKVVESVPEGGGTEGSKVVEQVHQDKTSPNTIPETSPSEREARARDFLKFWKAWPNVAVDSKPKAQAAFEALTPEERQTAIEAIPAFVDASRQAGRSKLFAAATYLAERKWRDLDLSAKTEAAATPERIKAWSRPWWAMLFAAIERGDRATMDRMLFWLRQGADLALRPGEAMPGGANLQQLKTSNPAWAEWEGWLADRGARLPDFKGPDFWVFVPSEWPPARADRMSEEELQAKLDALRAGGQGRR